MHVCGLAVQQKRMVARLADGVECSALQHHRTADHACAFDRAVTGDDCLDHNCAFDAGGAGDCWIVGLNGCDEVAGRDALG